jgi:hypothetical protein
MTDKIKNWYEYANEGKKDTKIKRCKNFKNHCIEPCSRSCMIGPSGCGKSTALAEYISRMPEHFYEIIFFTASTADEPIISYLKQKIPEMEIIENIEELPPLTEFNDSDKSKHKLIIFDDFITLPSKQMKRIEKYYLGSRKYGFSCICMGQRYTDIPKMIRENANYFFLFKQKNNDVLNRIIRNHNTLAIDKETFTNIFINCTKDQGNFLCLDMNPQTEMPLRHNFIGKVNPNKS